MLPSSPAHCAFNACASHPKFLASAKIPPSQCINTDFMIVPALAILGKGRTDQISGASLIKSDPKVFTSQPHPIRILPEPKKEVSFLEALVLIPAPANFT